MELEALDARHLIDPRFEPEPRSVHPVARAPPSRLEEATKVRPDRGVEAAAAVDRVVACLPLTVSLPSPPAMNRSRRTRTPVVASLAMELVETVAAVDQDIAIPAVDDVISVPRGNRIVSSAKRNRSRHRPRSRRRIRLLRGWPETAH